MVTFTAFHSVNMNTLTQLNKLANFDSDDDLKSHVTDTGFVDTFGGVDFRFVGQIEHFGQNINDQESDITVFTVKVDGINQFKFGVLNTPLVDIADFIDVATTLNGKNLITGSPEPDILLGFDGNDTINANGGNDVLIGGGDDDTLNGGVGNDRLLGDSGNDQLDGGAGADTLRGGIGSDRFLFRNASNANDRIVDFNTGLDRIGLDHEIFAGLGPVGSVLAAGKFHIGNNATTPGQRIIYDPDTTANIGTLFYDSNGSGAGGKTILCKLEDGLAMHAANFFVI